MVKTAVRCQDKTVLEQFCPQDKIRRFSILLTSLGLILSPESQFLDTNFMLLNKIRNGQIIQIVFRQNKTSENVKIIQRNSKLIFVAASRTVKLI